MFFIANPGFQAQVIIAACSPFFRTVLQRNPHTHPLLYLKGVKLSNLKQVLDFMYNGEVNVAQEELNTFLNVAEDLKVKGLTRNQSSKKQNSNSTTPLYLANHPCLTDRQPEPLARKPNPTSVLQPKRRLLPFVKNNQDHAQESGSVKSELSETTLVRQHQVVEAHPSTLKIMGDYGADNEEQKVDFSQIEGEAYYAQHGGDLNGAGGNARTHQCKECLKWYSSKRTLREHTPSHHGKTKCQFCEKIFSTVSGCKKHIRNLHSDQYYVNLDISE